MSAAGALKSKIMSSAAIPGQAMGISTKTTNVSMFVESPEVAQSPSALDSPSGSGASFPSLDFNNVSGSGVTVMKSISARIVQWGKV